MNSGARGRAAITGLLAVAIALTWQFLVVHYAFAGNWTSWFCTGGLLAQPEQLASEHLYRFPQSGGYDGQFYHYIAHDPLFQRGLDRYIDAPRLRYRRILVPGLAFLAAVGLDRWIDGALVAVNLLFIFIGAYWLARYATHYAQQPAWGVLFLLAPAVLVALDRLTVDLALTAFCIGLAVYVTEQRPGAIYAVLLLAPLARETGLLLTAAYCLVLVAQKCLLRAILFGTSALPAFAWFAFVATRTVPYDSTGWVTPVPLAGAIYRMLHPVTYPFLPMVKWSALLLDECSVAGLVLAFALSLRWPAQFPKPLALAATLITLSGITLGKPFWGDAFAFGRVFSPLVALVALEVFSTRSKWVVAPIALIDLRICLQLAYNLFLAARTMFS